MLQPIPATYKYGSLLFQLYQESSCRFAVTDRPEKVQDSTAEKTVHLLSSVLRLVILES